MSNDTERSLTKAFMILIPVVVAASFVTTPIGLWMILSLTYDPWLTMGMSLFGYVEWAVLAIAVIFLVRAKKWGLHPALAKLAKMVVGLFALGFVVGLLISLPTLSEAFEVGMRGGTIDQEALTLRLFEEHQTLFVLGNVFNFVLKLAEGWFWLQTRRALQAA